ncbi:MFS transporter [Lactococcus termiticola]|uniref:Major facilitator superfamily transporter n=1 Tax=Lactococcus termiticola TaxID=2169526 RepID=A0A2R5HJL6_9LACT|nr:MFS transporter [Lactococcus termiticola]GBG96810.1 major facilitator superfamily transporter [Lactococcus termiticola]
MKSFLDLDKNLQLRLVIVFLGSFSYGTVFSSMTIYYNMYMGLALTGLLLALMSLASFIAGLVAGHLADRLGRKPAVVGGVILQVLGAIMALASNSPLGVNPWTTYFAFMLISIGFSSISTAGNAMIIDLSDASNRKTVFALDYWAQNLSVIFGAAIGAWLFKHYFFELLWILLATILIELWIVVFPMTETLPKDFEASRENIFHAYMTVAKDKTYMIFLVANILSISVIFQFDNYLPIHLADQFQSFYLFGLEIYGQRMFTIYLIIACVIVVAFMGLVNRLTEGWKNLTGFKIGVVVMTVGMALSFLTVTWLPMVIAAVVYTIGEMIYTPNVQVIGADLMDPEKIGAYNGASFIRQPVGSIIAAGLVSLSAWVGSVGVSAIMSLLTILSILLASLAVRRHEKGL